MLPSAEFICLCVAYCVVFWEELSRLWRECLIQWPLLFWVHVIFFHSVSSWVGCSFPGKLFSISKLLCLIFVILSFFPHRPQELSTLVIPLRSSWENFFGDTRFVLLTQTIKLSRLDLCSVWIACIHFCKHSPSLPKWVSVIGPYCHHVNRIPVLVLCSHFEQLWMHSNCWTYMYWSCLLTTWRY